MKQSTKGLKMSLEKKLQNLKTTKIEIEADLAAHTHNGKVDEGYEYLGDDIASIAHDIRITEYDIENRDAPHVI